METSQTGSNIKLKPIHPFAARMAPEIAFEALEGLPKESIILDPMTGSGTVLRTISELGYNGIGFDIDPLSVLMAKAWTIPINEKFFLQKTDQILIKANRLTETSIHLPWIDDDNNTKDFIRFWFGPKQITDLRKLSCIVNQYKYGYASLYKIALSRLIITKTRGASLAADVSHSRPHRVRETNDFDVFKEYEKSCRKISRILNDNSREGTIKVKKGDARKLRLKSSSVDCIITSPPYLNALDYMRGHKLSLVWLGHSIGELSSIRSTSVGSEKAPEASSNISIAKEITKNITGITELPPKKINMVYRYALDIHNILKESARVLKPECKATFVVGNSCLQGIYIENTSIVKEAAGRFGLKLVKSEEREIPENKRYLPPPNAGEQSVLSKRMRTEAVMTFVKQ
ncbi:hypothetical protein [Daejeonella sp. JGW-45]|uniref:hypothetical protein n=1 Tax=Daejeonella sp. JGW-45 TaxID=3034148 RepID=UPI0023EB0347|nr:hypothetical protein [Daejeonella sp. JGW-45]